MPADLNGTRISLLLATDCSYHGTFNVAKMIATGIRTEFDVTLAVPKDDTLQPSLAHLRQLGIRVIETEASFEQLERSAYDKVEARRIVETSRPDVLLCCDGAHLFSLLALKEVAHENEIPFLMIVNSFSDDAVERFASLESLARKTLSWAAHIVFVSLALRTRFDAWMDVPGQRQVIPNVCGNEFFATGDPSARKRLRQQLSIPPEALVCCTVGRIERNKGQKLSLAALREVRRRGHECYWIYVGRMETCERKGFETALQSSGAHDSVRVLGERADVRDLLDASDVLVLTSYSEGMPLVVIEGLARGRAVFATAIDGVVEQVDATCGVLLPAPEGQEESTIEALAKAIEQVCLDPSLLDAMQKGALQRSKAFESSMAIETYASALQNLYAAVGHPVRPPVVHDVPLSTNGTVLDLTRPSNAWNVLGKGWTSCTPEGVFSQGAKSFIRLPLSEPMRSVKLSLSAASHNGASRFEVRVFLGDTEVARWKVGRREGSFSVNLDLESHARDLPVILVYDRTDAYERAIRVRQMAVERRAPTLVARTRDIFRISVPPGVAR